LVCASNSDPVRDHSVTAGSSPVRRPRAARPRQQTAALHLSACASAWPSSRPCARRPPRTRQRQECSRSRAPRPIAGAGNTADTARAHDLDHHAQRLPGCLRHLPVLVGPLTPVAGGRCADRCPSRRRAGVAGAAQGGACEMRKVGDPRRGLIGPPERRTYGVACTTACGSGPRRPSPPQSN
jgi:hypothetical protein